MGLLFDENQRMLTLFVNHCNKLSFLCFLSAIITSVVLVLEGYVDSTYISENALLPGYVNREFNDRSFLNSVLSRLKSASNGQLGKIQSDLILNEFRSIGLNAYTHNFTFIHPFGQKQKIEGKSVYAILEASRAQSTEAVVISAPYRSQTLPGISLMIALAKYFSKKNYLAKDLIFLVADADELGFQAWLDAYHEAHTSSALISSYLQAKSGPIQAAVNLEIHDDHVTQLDLKIEGINGQLPNLDLVNVAVELATRESITPTFHGRSHPFSPDFYEVSKDYAFTTASMMISQAKNSPTGAHGVFHKFAIQAITLEGKNLKSKQNEFLSVPFHIVGRVVEGIFRSLNNLLERFNRSYWFYLLASTRRYISIGYYMIPFGLMTVPLLFKALNIYLQIEMADSSGSLWTALPFNFYSHVLGFAFASLPFLIQEFSWIYQKYSLSFSDTIYYSLIVSSLIIVFNPLIKLNKSSSGYLKARQCVSLINLALILSCLSLLNISMALFLSFIMVPITYMSVSFSNNFLCKLMSIFVILMHPLTLSYLCILGGSLWFGSESDIMLHLKRSCYSHKAAILNHLENWYIYGNWAFFFGSAFLLPVWLQIWSIL